ncbi:MAG: hypothetical protein B6247_04040 [Candidatus Parabeggiatoa sp. nov. 2]|nr:MAG: hypothetical protein B6247_04040 [Beggiatoa sp. 4572_84]
MAAIQADEIVIHPAFSMNQTDNTGGIINSSVTIPSNALEQIVEDISEAERWNGIVRHYKLFQKIGNPNNKVYKGAKLFIGLPLQGGYVASLIKGDFNDVWADVKNNRQYGCALTTSDLTAGIQQITIITKNVGHFQQNDLIAIISQSDPIDSTGRLEFARIDQPIESNGHELTLHIKKPLRYNYPVSRIVDGYISNTRVASCIEYEDVKGTAFVSDKTSVHGTTDINEVAINSIAGITQTLTFVFDSANNFQVVSNLADVALPSGQKTAVYEPQNEAYLLPYLSIPPSFWTNDGDGDWVAGDSVKISTNPCAMPFWLVITVPLESEQSELEMIELWSSGYSGSR